MSVSHFLLGPTNSLPSLLFYYIVKPQKHCLRMEKEWIPLASALCCVNGIFDLTWPAPNEITIVNVWVRLVTTMLDAMFPHKVKVCRWESNSQEITFRICDLSDTDKCTSGPTLFSVVKYKCDNSIQMFITQFALWWWLFLSGFYWTGF